MAIRTYSNQPGYRKSYFLVILIFSISMFAVGVWSIHPAYATKEPSKPERIVIASGNNFVPMIFLSAEGKPEGILVDQWQLWSEKTGVKVELRPMDWANAIPALCKGEVDAVDGVSYTPARAEFLDMSTPHTHVPTYIFFHESISGIRGLSDLAGFPVGVLKGSHVEEHIHKNAPEIRLISYINYEEMEKAAAEGALRVFAGENPMLLFQFAKSGHRFAFSRTKTPILGNDIRVAVRKGDTAMLAIIEQGFAAITPKERQKIRNNWSGVSLASRIPWKWLILGGVAIFTVVILTFLWNFQLRKQVGLKTKELSHELAERKRAEAALLASEKKFRELAELLPETIFETDVMGNLEFVNRIAFDQFGYTQEDIEKGLNTFDMIAFEDREMASKNAQKILRGENLGLNEYMALRKDGSTFPVMIRSAAIFHEGRPAGLRGFIIDVSDKKRLEAQLQKAEKMESLGLMAGGIAHDLNNILSGIVSYPDLLLMDLPENSPLRRPIEIIKESGHRAAEVVFDLLTITKGAANVKEVLNLNTLIEEYMDSAEQNKLEKMQPAVTFRNQLDSELLNISCSPVHIKKILMNLVTNASESIEGSGNIVISTMNRYLDEPLTGYENVRQGEYAVLTVSDNGSGISPDDLERIFEPFYTKKVMGRSGTGLGLAVVWNSVQDHDGYINVKSGKEGTIFELYFPITRDELTTDKEQTPLEDYVGFGERILVVDDEENQREIACGLLAKLGYSAEAVSSGEEAIEYLKEYSVDLIVLDMIMPKGINGRETYEEIIKINPNQKAIIASGFAETVDVKKAQELGAGKYIKKPYTLEKIGIAVKGELKT